MVRRPEDDIDVISLSVKHTATTVISHKCRQVFRTAVAKAGPRLVCVQMEQAVSNGPSDAMVYGLNQHCPHRKSEHFLQSEPTDVRVQTGLDA